MQGMLLALVNGIFLQYARATTAVADAEDGTVDTQVGVVEAVELVVVGCLCQLGSTIGQGREREGLVNGGDGERGHAVATEYQHAAIAVVAAILRTGIVSVGGANLVLVPTNRTRGEAVGVVLPWTTTIPLYIIVL